MKNERFDSTVGCHYNPEYLCSLSDDELASEIRSLDSWDADLCRELCYRADLLAAVLWLYQQPAMVKIPGHNEYVPAKSFVIHRDGSIVRCRQEYDPRFGQFFPRSEDGVAQIGGCVTIDSVAEWQ